MPFPSHCYPQILTLSAVAVLLYAFAAPVHSQTVDITKKQKNTEETDTNSPPSPAPTAYRVLLLGDSLTEGYGVMTDQAYPAVAKALLDRESLAITFIQASISGSTTASGPGRLRWQLKSQPTHVLLALGSNDGLRGLPLQSIETNIEIMIVEAKKHGVKPLLVGLRAPPNMAAHYTNGFRQIFPRLAQKHQVPLWDFILKDVGGEKDKNLPDGIHPNVAGHGIIGKYFAEFLKIHLFANTSSSPRPHRTHHSPTINIKTPPTPSAQQQTEQRAEQKKHD